MASAVALLASLALALPPFDASPAPAPAGKRREESLAPAKRKGRHTVFRMLTDVHHRITLTREAARSRAAAAATCRGSAGWRRRRGRPVVAQRPRAGVGVRGSRALMRATVRVPVCERESARRGRWVRRVPVPVCACLCVCVCMGMCDVHVHAFVCVRVVFVFLYVCWHTQRSTPPVLCERGAALL